MPDLDLNQPLPDRAHDAIRAAVVQAIADLGDTLTLTDVLFDLADTAITTDTESKQERGKLQQRLDYLTARVAKLETQVAGLVGG